MDFGWSESDRRAHDAARALGASLAGDIDVRDRTGTFDRTAWSTLATHGFLGAFAPKHLGGQGQDFLRAVHLHEGLARGLDDAGLLLAVHAHLFGCLPILLGGTEAQQQRWVTGLATGAQTFALAMTEAEAGSDAFAMASHAVRDHDHYVICGEKLWITNGPIADRILVFARTGDGPPLSSLSCFLVDGQQPGVTRHPDVPRLGLRTAEVGPVSFDEVRVPLDHCIGSEGAGARLFLSAMEHERIGIMTAALGSMDRLLHRCLRHARTPRGPHPTLQSHQAVTHRIADLRADLDASRLLLYRAAWRLAHGRRAPAEAAISKLQASEAHVRAALTALRTFGGAGLIEGSGIERAFRDATCGLVYSGTSDIQRNLIASMMGL